MNRKTVSLSLVLVLLSVKFPVSAQTGTRISEAVGSRTQNIIWFSEPHEIEEVRKLLTEGNNRLALQVADAFVKRMEKTTGLQAMARRYYGLNALCSALTSNGRYSKAIETCNQAIELHPDHWQAYNNRGTVYYVTGEYDLAIQDYQRAFEIRPETGDITSIIQHNIDLAQANIGK